MLGLVIVGGRAGLRLVRFSGRFVHTMLRGFATSGGVGGPASRPVKQQSPDDQVIGAAKVQDGNPVVRRSSLQTRRSAVRNRSRSSNQSSMACNQFGFGWSGCGSFKNSTTPAVCLMRAAVIWKNFLSGTIVRIACDFDAALFRRATVGFIINCSSTVLYLGRLDDLRMWWRATSSDGPKRTNRG